MGALIGNFLAAAFLNGYFALAMVALVLSAPVLAWSAARSLRGQRLALEQIADDLRALRLVNTPPD